MDYVKEPGFFREKCQHSFKDLKPLGFFAWDDLLHINTQSGSQWDGFRHWGHQETGLYYNNFPHDEIPKPENILKNSTHHWSERGGIVGRGVLIDYVLYAERHNISYSPTTRHAITVAEIEECAKEQGVSFKPCDIILIRSGFVKWYESAGQEEQVEKAKNGHEFAGMEGSAQSVEWLWDHHFAAVGGDAIAFEAWPPKAPYSMLSLAENERGELTMIENRTPRPPPRYVGHAHRRALEPRGIGAGVRQREEIQLFLDLGTVECCGRRCESTKRFGYFVTVSVNDIFGRNRCRERVIWRCEYWVYICTVLNMVDPT